MKNSSKTVFELKNYGRINIKLKEILECTDTRFILTFLI